MRIVLWSRPTSTGSNFQTPFEMKSLSDCTLSLFEAKILRNSFADDSTITFVVSTPLATTRIRTFSPKGISDIP